MMELLEAPGRYRTAFDHLPGGEPAWLLDLRTRAMEQFETAGFPGRREEAWRFTDLKALRKLECTRPDPAAVPMPGGDAVAGWSLAGPQALRLVFVNGVLAPELSAPTPEGDPCTLGTLVRARARSEDEVRARLGSVVDPARHRFAALNTAFLSDGAWIDVREDGTNRPLHLIFVSMPGEDPPMIFPRVLIRVAEGAAATVIEEHVGGGPGPLFTAPVTEIQIDANGALDHTRLQHEGAGTFHLGTLAARLDRDARFTSHVVSLGARLARLDLDLELAGPGSEATLNGLYLAGSHQHTDHHTRVDHAVPHTASRQLYQGVLDGKGRAVFNGRVVIHPGADKVEAAQNNNNLLLSDDALVNTNPELEIFADDVKAQHGATVGQIEEEHLFYLRSRGLDERTARQVLIYAFANKMVERLPVESLRVGLTARIEDRF